eukprot:TRINITY_DN27773_c0_g1_i1.p1 TRINITY_DN27773_c0_g1~~TRINITY_DN27773_c0_g1_i1.p1  ORF type:complete len:585 (+),score=149.39 TRINITY_DN27773_c0_g1_i1:70-1824(+)
MRKCLLWLTDGRAPARGLLLLSAAASARGGGGGPKIWELGTRVEENPVTSFVMFAMVMGIMVVVVMGKSAAEAFTDDPHRRSSYGVIYIELMMVGFISFLITLAGEFGLWSIRIGCDEDGSSSSPPSNDTPADGSGFTSVVTCGSGFSLLLFEYAHLVLFFMGLSYCVFIIRSFQLRDTYCKEIEKIEATTLNEWCAKSMKKPSQSGLIGAKLGAQNEWTKVYLALRAAIIVENRETLRRLCLAKRQKLLLSLARHGIRQPPSKLPPPQVAESHFSMARFTKITLSNVLVHQLHVSPWVWFSILVVATTYLAHRAGLSLESSVFGSSAFGTFLGLWLLWTLSSQLQGIAERAIAHPYVAKAKFHKAAANEDLRAGQNALETYIERNVPRHARAAAAAWADGSTTPWEPVVASTVCFGCTKSSAKGGKAMVGFLIQMQAFITCFYIGQLMMLTTFMWDKIGSFTFFAWLIPLPALLLWGPRALLLYALVHYSERPPKEWLEYSMKGEDDPEPDPDVGGDLHASESERRAFLHNVHLREQAGAAQPRQTAPRRSGRRGKSRLGKPPPNDMLMAEVPLVQLGGDALR